LLVDIGNTRTKWLVAGGDGFFARGSVLNDQLAGVKFCLPSQLDSVWVSCVGGDELFDKVADRIREVSGLSVNRAVVKEYAAGMHNAYRAIDRLGVDRWVAALGARSLVPQGDLIVIDAGTAITIDVVSQANRFEGGVILPGRVLMQRSLVSNTAGVLSVPSEVDSVIGKSTQQCVNSGALYGLVGAIERVVSEIKQTFREPEEAVAAEGSLQVLICGGDADKLLPLLSANYRFEPDVLFYGLLVASTEGGEWL